MPLTAKEIGARGEQLAMRHLKRLGMEIVEMNYRYGHGEIDIIARDGETLVFCEVKSRVNDEFGDPEYALTPRKQQQIRRIAQAYLYEHEIKEQDCRFDVVAIRFMTRPPQINYIRNAF
ncbi:MAG: YraN family protein [Bacteroidota bacterium]